jgi:hypothetical protein
MICLKMSVLVIQFSFTINWKYKFQHCEKIPQSTFILYDWILFDVMKYILIPFLILVIIIMIVLIRTAIIMKGINLKKNYKLKQWFPTDIIFSNYDAKSIKEKIKFKEEVPLRRNGVRI